MNEVKYLNIVTFDVPYPADYGGAIDVYFQLRAFSQAGIRIILHCFQYADRKPAVELEVLCEKVYYYNRDMDFKRQCGFLPYSVWSRKNKELIANLLLNDYPILFEGLMSCYYLNDKRLANRKKYYREANIEHQYYLGLAKAEKAWVNKLYYYAESLKMYFYQNVLKKADVLFPIAKDDESYLRKKFPYMKMLFIPAFHQNNVVTSKLGKADYILYHGNLAVPENKKAALFLIYEVFSHLPYRCVVAGRNPDKSICEAASVFPNIKVVSNPSQVEMEQLIADAHIHLLYTCQPTGLKLKLLNVLHQGRFVVLNQLMLAGSGLDGLCVVANTPHEMIKCCIDLWDKDFLKEERMKREEQLSYYNCMRLAQKMMKEIYA